MKSSSKKWLIVSGVLIALGVVVCVIVFLIIGFDFSVLNTEKERMEKEYSFGNNYLNIEIDDSDSDIVIRKSQSDQIKVLCYENEDIKYSFVQNDAKETLSLSIKKSDNRKWYRRILNFQKDDLIIELPEKAYGFISSDSASGDISVKDITAENLYLKSSSGDIKADGVSCQKTAELNSSSGDIWADGLSAEDIKAYTRSGDINIKNSLDAVSIEAETSSGDAKISAISAEAFKASSSSGDISLSDTDTSECALETSSGDVSLSDTDASEYKIETSSGDIRGTVRGDENSVSFFTDSGSGNISVPKNSKGEKSFNASSSSGDIVIRFSK